MEQAFASLRVIPVFLVDTFHSALERPTVKGMVHLIYKSHIKAELLCAKYNALSVLIKIIFVVDIKWGLNSKKYSGDPK